MEISVSSSAEVIQRRLLWHRHGGGISITVLRREIKRRLMHCRRIGRKRRRRNAMVMMIRIRRYLRVVLRLKLLSRASEKRLQIADELVHVSFTGNLVYDVLIVVVAQTSAQFLVVHLGLILSFAPALSDDFRVGQLEFPFASRPDNAIHVAPIGEKFEQKLPQLNWAAALGVSRRHCRLNGERRTGRRRSRRRARRRSRRTVRRVTLTRRQRRSGTRHCEGKRKCECGGFETD